LMRSGATLAIAILIAVLVDVALFNAYPFYCERPWSPWLLLSSARGLATYVTCLALHTILISVAPVLIPVLYVWSSGYRLRRDGVWAPLALAASLAGLSVAAIVATLSPLLAALGSLNLPRAESRWIYVLRELSEVFRLWVAPSILPLAVACSFTSLRGRYRDVAIVRAGIVLMCLGSVLACSVLAPLVALGIDTALAALNPLALFTYFRCVDPRTAQFIASDLSSNTTFSPALQTWGGLAGMVIELFIVSKLCRALTELLIVEKLSPQTR